MDIDIDIRERERESACAYERKRKREKAYRCARARVRKKWDKRDILEEEHTRVVGALVGGIDRGDLWPR